MRDLFSLPGRIHPGRMVTVGIGLQPRDIHPDMTEAHRGYAVNSGATNLLEAAVRLAATEKHTTEQLKDGRPPLMDVIAYDFTAYAGVGMRFAIVAPDMAAMFAALLDGPVAEDDARRHWKHGGRPLIGHLRDMGITISDRVPEGRRHRLYELWGTGAAGWDAVRRLGASSVWSAFPPADDLFQVYRLEGIRKLQGSLERHTRDVERISSHQFLTTLPQRR